MAYLNLTAATWGSPGSVRYYAVDNDAGNDTNLGFSDVSMAAAGAVAIKTLEHLRAILPKFGNGRSVVIACKARAGGATYKKIDTVTDDSLDFTGFYGYQFTLVRGTATDATASAVAFTNDAADRVFCGARQVPGTNAAGYNPTGVPTTSVFDCTLAGGGAPGLAAEPALRGKRVRFDSATTTVALRNVCRVITANDTDTITVGPNLPTAPAAGDVFYIEEPGFAVDKISLSGASYGAVVTATGFHVAGIRSVGTSGTAGALLRYASDSLLLSFVDIAHANATTACNAGDVPALFFVNVYTTEDGSFITTGSGVRTVGGQNFQRIPNLFVGQSHALTRFTLSDPATGTIGGDCSTVRMTTQGGLDLVVGNQNVASNRPLRLIGAPGAPLLRIGSSQSYQANGIQGTRVDGVTFENSTTTLIEVRGVNQAVTLRGCVNGAVANTGQGLDLSSSFGATVVMLSGNTFTASAGRDIVGQGDVRYVHADYARCDLTDNQRNVVAQGGNTIGPATIATNDAFADIGQYKIVRATGSGVVRAAQADSAADASGVVGVTQSPMTAAGSQNAMIVSGGNTWVQFDAAPSAGDPVYLSTATAGNAQVAAPVSAGTNQKLPLGRVLSVSGTLGYVSWSPTILPVAA